MIFALRDVAISRYGFMEKPSNIEIRHYYLGKDRRR